MGKSAGIYIVRHAWLHIGDRSCETARLDVCGKVGPYSPLAVVFHDISAYNEDTVISSSLDNIIADMLPIPVEPYCLDLPFSSEIIKIHSDASHTGYGFYRENIDYTERILRLTDAEMLIFR